MNVIKASYAACGRKQDMHERYSILEVGNTVKPSVWTGKQVLKVNENEKKTIFA